jgi:hypothetical protein
MRTQSIGNTTNFDWGLMLKLSAVPRHGFVLTTSLKSIKHFHTPFKTVCVYTGVCVQVLLMADEGPLDETTNLVD